MKFLLSFGITLFVLSISFSQIKENEFDTYLLNLDKARNLEKSNNFSEAIKYFDLAIKYAKKHPNFNIYGHSYMSKASVFFKLNKFKKGIKEVKKAIVAGSELEVIDYNYLFSDSISVKIKDVILPIYRELVKEKFSKMKNPEAYVEIEKMIVLDQFNRMNDGLLTSENIPVDKLQNITDSALSQQCVELVKKHGWFNEMWLIMWHNRDTYKQKNDFWNFMIPFINNQIELGMLPHSFFAMYEDYKSLEETGFTIYGTITSKVNKETINLKRAEIFLPALSEDIINSYNNK
ncbi:hypothetical protein G6N05_06640 [Flavobacterium sp. F372]|uniref:Tetratricopeptide repeat protein n=1 Tax=Flavobacterium bernardetii TaxID=2813823 RepID=A0ABR7J087_9FLAO|nr:hypothetical protein [Flavobacterium bernardetii]MBC5835439.1 hypothetical protein [Flavobacterium bernardetii]NHF69782.1 hypothetical protein [Flavobacterium bernardetii]